MTDTKIHTTNQSATKEKITLSLIVPIYGVEDYIIQFADSVLSQSYPYIEYIFVDDATQDNSIQLLKDLIAHKYIHRKEQIKIVHKECNGGLPAARQTGLEHATGDYIYHVDPDDWLSEESIEKIVATIRSTNADIIYFNYFKDYPTRSKKKRVKIYNGESISQYIQDMYNHKTAASVWNKCFKRSLYTDNRIFIPTYSYAEDCCVTTQLAGYAKSIAYLDEYIYHYRKGNPKALTKQQIRKRKREYANNFMELYDTYHDLPIEQNPIAPICDHIVLQAGWYSTIFALGLFQKYPYLANAIGAARIQKGTNVCIVFQIITKFIAFIHHRRR